MQDQILARTRTNLARLDAMLAEQSLLSRLLLEAGWYAVLRAPALGPDEELALSLLERGVSIHPGSFFGFPEGGFLVASLLTPEAEFVAGINVVIESLDAFS
jgi:alanine-synthesizing transaminase